MRDFALAVGIMIGFFAGLFLMVQATERWSPWTEPAPTPTPTVTRTSDTPSTSMPPATPSSTAIATTTPTPTLVPEQVRVTWYGEAFRGGLLYCGTDIYGRYDPDDPTTVAALLSSFECGQRLVICTPAACRVGIVKDQCPGCQGNWLDLSRALWLALGGYDYAEIYY